MKNILQKILPNKMYHWIRLTAWDIKDFGWFMALVGAWYWEILWEEKMIEYHEKENHGYYDLSSYYDNLRYWRNVRTLEKMRSYVYEEMVETPEAAT